MRVVMHHHFGLPTEVELEIAGITGEKVEIKRGADVKLDGERLTPSALSAIGNALKTLNQTSSVKWAIKVIAIEQVRRGYAEHLVAATA